jgi:hypothetical protein
MKEEYSLKIGKGYPHILFFSGPLQFPKVFHFFLFEETGDIAEVFFNLLVAKFKYFAYQAIEEIAIVRYQY